MWVQVEQESLEEMEEEETLEEKAERIMARVKREALRDEKCR